MAINIVLVSLSLGTAIAKHIAKTWIGSDLLDQVAEELIDLVKGSAEEKSITRNQRLETEQLAVAASQRMRQVYDISNLSENSKLAVAAEVAITLSKSNTSVDHIVAQSMDESKLAKQMLSTKAHVTRDFSLDETALYEQLIKEAASAQIQASSLLESFDGAFAARLLKDNDRLTMMLEKFLTEPLKKASQFEEQYQATIRRKLDRLEIFGLPSLDNYGRHQPLSIAYISLDAKTDQSLFIDKFLSEMQKHYEDVSPTITLSESALYVNSIQSNLLFDIPSIESWTRVASGLINFEDNDIYSFVFSRHLATRLNSIESAIAKKRRIIVQGQAGSGKTTLLQWLAVRASSSDFEPPLSNWNKTIPFFIRLREYVDSDFPSPEEFLDRIAPMLKDKKPQSWVHDVLDSGRGLVLIDGVDELPMKQRNTMLERLSDLVATYPASRYVISSRPAALKEQLWPEWKEWISDEGFFSTQLRDMDTILVANFIEQWHTAFASTKEDVEEQEEIKKHISDLKSLLNGRPSLHRLAKNPLLCAMICALYQDRKQNLPSERLKLYEECIDMLLTRRDEGRRVPVSYEYPTLAPAQRQSLIQDLAYWMFLNGYSDIEIDLADKRFLRRLPILSLTDITGEGVRRFFVERTNLLREPVVGRLDFAHLTFQEYLAALEAVEEGDFGLLQEHATDDKWREAIVLATGIARQNEREKLLDSFLRISRRRNIKMAKRKQVALLALACLETSVSLSPELRNRILQNASIAIPPSDEDEEKLVASAGDPAVSLLVPNEDYSEKQSVSCIRTLAMIGSETAMLRLADFANDSRNQVRRALTSVWDNFDREKYANVVLGSLTDLSLNNTIPIQGIKNLKNLQKLSVVNFTWENDLLREIAQLPKLIELNISSSEDEPDFSALADLKSLKKFSYKVKGYREIASLDGFSSISQLTHLNVEVPQLTANLRPLRHLVNLEELSIGTIRGNSIDVQALQFMKKLHTFKLTTYKTSFDLNSLRDLPQLQYLTIRSRIIPKSTEAISLLSNLVTLSIPLHIEYMDLESWRSLNNLMDLTIEIGDDLDFSQLASLPSLRRLKIVSRKSLDVSTLSTIKQLEHLDISQAQVNSLEPILTLPNLNTLRLRYNHEYDLDDVGGLQGLIVEVDEPPLHQELLQQRNLRNELVHASGHGEISELFGTLREQEEIIEAYEDAVRRLTELAADAKRG